MSHSVLANWAYSKFEVQITQNAISLVIKKRTDLECNTDDELSANVRQSLTIQKRRKACQLGCFNAK